MNRMPEEWALVSPRAVATEASPAACENVLRMMQQDIAEQAALIDEAHNLFIHVNWLLDNGGSPAGETRERFNRWMERADAALAAARTTEPTP